jgi:hypothetical protein
MGRIVSAFNNASGVSVGALALSIALLVAAIATVFGARLVMGLLTQWRSEQNLTWFDLLMYIGRVCVVLMLLYVVLS